MSVNGKLLGYLQEGVTNLLEAGHFENGREFRPTQQESLLAYKIFLERPDLPDKERLTGYFEIPTGIGKTALFSGLSGVTHALSAAQVQNLRTVIVVPTIGLLTQTKSGLEEFSPSLAGRIGLYGGEKDRDLSRPISIITYDSWLKLIEQGDLNSNNVDLLISDEAHRGTSVRKLTNLFNSFDARTARIAFTATAHFDEQKSVQKTHHHEIFYKSLADGVRGGELAAYVQTQMHIIRVEPPENLSPEFGYESEGVREQRFRRALKQAAWNNAAVAFYRDSIDHHTGDPVSDNQVGFFTDGVHQAIELEKKINADPVLSQKAIESGYKGVALVVYAGKMSPSEQSRRIEAYKRGEYMAIVGDEKFKEGFDHPPMKTIIDVPHGSLVDKAQILGRGTRQWENPAKGNRQEGLTFIDTIVYVGSNDPKEDESRRNLAIYNAVTSWKILGGTVVLGPGQEEQLNKGYVRRPHLNIKGVESYVDPGDVNTLFSEYEKLRRESWIDITEDMRKFLNAEEERTGTGIVELLELNDFPEGLSAPVVYSWKYGKTVKANPSLWNWVIESYAHCPNVKFTQEMSNEIKAEAKRTGVGPQALVNNSKDCPVELTRGLLGNWLYGTPERVNLSLWQWTINKYKQLPTVGKRIDITDDMLTVLNAEIDRTKIGPAELIRTSKGPEGLSGGNIKSWQQRMATTVFANYWSWVIQRYKELPSRESRPTITITDDMRAHLSSEAKRTGIGAKLLFNSDDFPQGLGLTQDEYKTKHQGWLNGDASSADDELWNWTIERYAEYPDAKPRIKITHEMLELLRAETDRTGVGGSVLLSNTKDKPEGLTPSVIAAWKSEGKTKTAILEQWDWVIEAYSNLPDAKSKIKITDNMRNYLIREIERTQVKGTLILKETGAPDDLKNGTIAKWYKGTAKKTYLDHWNWVIDTYKKLPDAEIRPRTQITDEICSKLQKEFERTGFGAQSLIVNSPNAPKGLTYQNIHTWKTRAETADAEHLKWVMNAYAALPDAKPMMTITETMRENLDKEMIRSGVGAYKLLQTLKSPEGLTNGKIESWRSGGTKTVDASLWEWVIKTYASLPDKEAKLYDSDEDDNLDNNNQPEP